MRTREKEALALPPTVPPSRVTARAARRGTGRARYLGHVDSMVCSTVCRCTRSSGRGSPNGAGRIPLSPGTLTSSSNSAVPRPELRRVRHLVPTSSPGRLLALCAVVRKRGQGRSDRLLQVSPPRAQSLVLLPLGRLL